MTEVGIAFDGLTSVGSAIETARRAERSGMTSFWVAEHLGYREATLASMAVLLGTASLTVVPTAVSPYLRHPIVLAMGAATLSEVASSRVALALGIGNPLFLSESGIQVDKPVVWLKEYLDCLRQLWTGEPARYAGSIFTLDGARLGYGTPLQIPIRVAATGPAMLRLAGRAADGVVLSGGISAEYTGISLRIAGEAAASQGRDPAALRAAGFLITAVSEDGRTAIEACRAKLAFVLRNRHLAENVAHSGIPINHEAIIAAVGRRDLEEARSLVPDDAIDAFTIAGTARHCRKRLEEYISSGLDEVVLSLVGPVENYQLAFDLARHIRS